MPDTTLALPTVAYTADALIRLQRRPALAGFLARKVLAAGQRIETRRGIVEACKAELDWARSDWTRIVGSLSLGFDVAAEEGADAGWIATRLPHEIAAATVVNCWAHLHPCEASIRKCMLRLRDQREAGWQEQTVGTVDDLRWYWTERAKVRALFWSAVSLYQNLRAEVDRTPGAPACAKRAA